MVLRENSQKSVKFPVHQQDKHGSTGNSEGRVKSLSNLHRELWDHEACKQLVNEDVILEEDDGLGEHWVIIIEGRCNDSFIEDRVGEDVD